MIVYIILLVFIVYMYVRPKIVEYFTKNIIEFNSNQFINPKEFISEYKSILDKYVLYFNKKNLEKRQLKNIDELHKKYIDSLRECNSLFIYQFNKNINSNINNNILPFLKFIVPKSKVVRSINIENNYPHTHKDIMFYNSVPSGYIIVHELTHIDQRINVNFYNNIYNEWGFINVDNIENFNSIRELNRTNPDGLNINWLWLHNNKYYWIGKLYNNNYSNISDATTKICIINKVNDKYIYTGEIMNMSQSKEYLEYFGNIPGNNYHPNELSAEYLTELIYNDRKVQYPAEKIFLTNYINRFIK